MTRRRLPFAPVERLLLDRYGLGWEWPAQGNGRNPVRACAADGTSFTDGAVGRFLEGADPRRAGLVRLCVVQRWRAKGLDVWEADACAQVLGLHPLQVWADYYDDVDNAPEQLEFATT